MSLALPIRRRILLPGPWARNELWKAARAVPSWHIAPVRTGTVNDLISGSNIITFTNSSPAWGFNSSGVLVQPTANVPFIEYDAATGACLGWRVWDAVTNLLTYSNDFTQAAWVKTIGGTGTTPVVTENYALSPDGTMNATRLQCDRGASDTSSDSSYIQQSATGLPSTHTVTMSVWIKSNTGVNQSVYFTNTNNSGTTAITATTTWHRFSFTVTRTSQTSNSLRIGSRGSFNTDSSIDILIYGAEGQLSDRLAPYVPTGALAASSTADVASISGAAFSGIWNQEATVYSDIRRPSAVPSGAFRRAWQASDGTSANRIEQSYYYGGQANYIARSGAVQAEWYPAYFAQDGVRAAFAFATNDVAGASNGVITGSDNLATIPAVDRIFLGSEDGSVNILQGYIRELAVFNSRRPKSNLQAMTQ